MDKLSRSMLKALHAVFDREPQAEPMFRVRAPDGLTMTVSGGSLTLEHAGGPHVYALDGLSIAELIDRLEADGFEVPWQSQSGTSVGAHTLLEVSQDQYVRDTLDAYANPLWAHMDALGAGVGIARDQIAPMLRQIVLPHAEGEWADLFGQIFGIPRRAGESDGDFTQRIVAEVGRARSSPAAILANILRLTGDDLALREPWMEIFALSRSALSGPDHLQGAPIWQYHTMQLVARVGPDWARVLPEAEADRPAGTVMLPPATHPWPLRIAGAFDGMVLNVCRLDRYAEHLRWYGCGRLSWDLVLSDGPRCLRNEAMAWIDVRAMTSNGLRGPYRALDGETTGWFGPWDGRAWAMEPAPAEMAPPKAFVQAALVDDDDYALVDDDDYFLIEDAP